MALGLPVQVTECFLTKKVRVVLHIQGMARFHGGYESNHHRIHTHFQIPVSISGLEESVAYACSCRRRLSLEHHSH